MTNPEPTRPLLFIGIDTGGTFTDVVAVEAITGRRIHEKVLSTPDDPSEAIAAGLRAVLERTPGASVRALAHGTTVATNSVLEDHLPTTGMLTTEGFRDIVELGRQRRPDLYDLSVQKPDPVAQRPHRLEIAERIGARGEVVRPLDANAAEVAVRRLAKDGVQAVAVCLVHSYANPEHEQRVVEIVRSVAPDLYVCASSEALQEFREYERFNTALLNVALMPVVDRYLAAFQERTKAMGVHVQPRIMQSNGGAVAVDNIRQRPVNTLFSGPAAGVIGAAVVAGASGDRDIITFDMGGTSTDVCLVRDGAPMMKFTQEIRGLAIRISTIDIHSVGAGGGSVAWVDPGGLLKVGPRSAGAHPGPAGYGRGGVVPTVTDANLHLGRLNQQFLLGGRMPVYPERSRVVLDRLAQELHVDVNTAAAGILRVVDANMMQAVRVISVEAGYDPREFGLVAFGGAGPMHATDVARHLGIGRVIVPQHSGLLCAYGLLCADPRTDVSLTRLMSLQRASVDNVAVAFAELAERVREWMRNEGLAAHDVSVRRVLEMRYMGQNFQLGVEVRDEHLGAGGLSALVEAFHEKHLAAYGYRADDEAVEVVNFRLAAQAPRPDLPPPPAARRSSRPSGEVRSRLVWFEGQGFLDTPVLWRDHLAVGRELTGPAVVEEMDTTTILCPGDVATVDPTGNLVIRIDAVGGKGAVNEYR